MSNDPRLRHNSAVAASVGSISQTDDVESPKAAATTEPACYIIQPLIVTDEIRITQLLFVPVSSVFHPWLQIITLS